ncbi:MAG: CpaF family protein [Solirubrobacterales bacterium]
MGPNSLDQDSELERFAKELRERAIADARARRIAMRGDGDSVRDHVQALVEREAPALSARLRQELVERVVTASTGFGPLEALLADDSVDEIMVNGHQQVWVERGGVVSPTDVAFESAVELEDLIERMIAPLGRRVDEASPICDARLPDGSRVNVVIPPLALGGPALTIRRFRHSHFDPAALVENGTLSARAHDFLALSVERRLSLLVSGGTGSGKTTTLNALSAFVPESERIVTIEDAAELRLRQGHVVRLEARPANLEGLGEVTIRALVRTALRMRPDRIVVGEVRGGEALDMLAAMTTGHDGSLTTVHANSPAGALDRVQTLALMAGVDVPHEAVRRMAASAIDLVVHQARVAGGRRRVAAISEVGLGATGELEVRPLMEIDNAGHEQWKPTREARVASAMGESP